MSADVEQAMFSGYHRLLRVSMGCRRKQVVVQPTCAAASARRLLLLRRWKPPLLA